tara:strand:- start:57 stop:755 length:699 start_codon:yes stop_codon:yes gene_type:complete
MKKALLPILGVTLVLSACDMAPSNTSLETLTEKASYSIGQNIAKNFKSPDAPEISNDALVQGIRDALNDESELTEEEQATALQEFQTQLQKDRTEKQTQIAGVNKVAGQQYLNENKTKDGVIELESGLQYKVIKAGQGRSPKLTENVTVHYRGTLINGTEFDSSYKRNQPVSFPVNGVIKGWTEALQRMKPGDKWMLYIPSELAYGDAGAGALIEPGSTLIFETELISIDTK